MGIYLKVTNRCNIRCPHCFIADYSGDMPLDIVEKVSEKYPGGRIIFHGGEPTLVGRAYIEKAIRILGDREFIMQSNLIMDNTEIYQWIELITRYFKSSVGTSIDSGRIPYMQQWCRNVEILANNNISVIATVTVTNDISAADIMSMLDMFGDCGGSGFYLQIATPVKTEPVDYDHYFTVWKMLKEHPLNFTSKRLTRAFSSPCNVSGISGGNCAKNGVRTVDVDGTVYVCPDFAGQKIFALGNINDKDFDDTVANKANDIFYDREYELSLSCDEDCWRYCKGGCASLSYFSKKLSYRDPYCTVYKRIFSYANS